MATESPLRMPSHKETATIAPSIPNVAVEDLGLLRKGPPRQYGSGRDIAPHRSGSAPPSMEGSFLAINNLISQKNSNLSVGNLNDFVQSIEQEKQSYLAYYGSNANPNARLPTPPIPMENRHLGHCIGRFVGNRVSTSIAERTKSCLHLSPVTLSTHKEESEDDHSPKQLSNDLVDRTIGYWTGEDADSMVGQSKSLVDLIQEDFPRTPSPLYNQSQSLHSGKTGDAADDDADCNSLHHHRVSMSHTASTPCTNGIGFSLNASSSSLVSSLSSFNCIGTAQPTPHLPKGNLNNGDVTVIESQMKDLNISSPPNPKEQRHQEQWHHGYQSNMLQHQVQPQQNDTFHDQGPKYQMGMNSSYVGMDQFLQGPSKFSVEAQPVLQSSGFTPPLYATAAATATATATATACMTSPNPYYMNLQAPMVYPPQYGVGGYALNSTVVPPFVSGYPPHGAVPMVFDGSAGPNFNTRMSGASSGGSMAQGIDMQHVQHFNKLYGHLGYALQPSFADPVFMQYYQQPYGPACGISCQFDPISGSGFIGNQNNAPHSNKRSEAPAGLEDQKLQHHRSGMSNVNQGRGGIMNPHYFGNQPSMGVLMRHPSSPLASPILPGSPVGGTGVAGGRPAGSGRYAAVYSGWQGQRGLESINNPKIYNFLEELKSGRGRRFELSNITGHIVEFSADQHGSRFIQQKLENCSAEEKASVFKEVLPCSSKLMTDVFGNYVIQKFFEYGNLEQRKELANQLTGQILPLSLQMYGCRVIQKALEVIELDQKAQLAHELDGHVMRCVRDQNGNHVIQKCIESVPTEKIGFIISAFHGEVATLSMHPYGCRVIQRVLEHCTNERQCQFVVDEILESVCVLAQDQYGNYVTQHVLERGKPFERHQIISKLAGHVVQLSQHKYASNVVEKCLEYGGPTEQEVIIEEILGQNEGSDNLLTMMKDQFANYVVQKILDICTDAQRTVLLNRIRMHMHALKKYTYGKHIVARFEQQFGEDIQPHEHGANTK